MSPPDKAPEAPREAYLGRRGSFFQVFRIIFWWPPHVRTQGPHPIGNLLLEREGLEFNIPSHHRLPCRKKMTDQDIIDEFIEVHEEEAMTRFTVKIIEWPHPAEPVTRLSVVSAYKGRLSPEQIEKEKLRISRMRRYFRRCGECKQLNPVGWMLDAAICQACASRNHEVVF